MEKVEIFGVSYEFTPLTSEMLKEYETWVRAEAWKEIQSFKKDMPADDYKVAVSHIAERMAGKYYRIGGEGFAMAESSIEGKYRKIWLMLKAKQPDLKWETILKWQDSTFDAELGKLVTNGK